MLYRTSLTWYMADQTNTCGRGCPHAWHKVSGRYWPYATQPLQFALWPHARSQRFPTKPFHSVHWLQFPLLPYMANITSPTVAALALVVGSPLQGIPHDGTALGRCDELAGIVLSTSREPGVSCEYMYVYVHIHTPSHIRLNKGWLGWTLLLTAFSWQPWKEQWGSEVFWTLQGCLAGEGPCHGKASPGGWYAK